MGKGCEVSNSILNPGYTLGSVMGSGTPGGQACLGAFKKYISGLLPQKPDFIEWRTAGSVKEHSGCRTRSLGLSLGSLISCVVLSKSLTLSGPTFRHPDKDVSPGAASLWLLRLCV